MRNFLTALLGVLAASFALSLSANAQTPTKGFALDRFDPADPTSSWIALDSVDFRGKSRGAVSLVGDYAHIPLAAYNDDAERTATIVESQLFVHLSGSLVFGERVRVGMSLPLAPFIAANPATASETYVKVDEGFSVGDLRLSADVRLTGQYDDPFSLAVGASLWLPTGKEAAYAGDGKVRFEPRVAMAGAVARFRYAVRLGFRYRGRDDQFAGGELGSELTFGAGIGVTIIEGLTLGPELLGGTVVRGGPFRPEGTPVEALLGLRYQSPRGLYVHGAGGPGLTRGIGAPEYRVVVSLGWAKPVRAWRQLEKINRVDARNANAGADADRDGVPDGIDACPNQAGVLSDDPGKQGCPPSDADVDGIPDAEDACPSTAGIRSADRKKNGCKVNDRDHDGIDDPNDTCPDQKGLATANPRTHGCADSDADSIFDPLDACPTITGTPNLDPSKSGCPIARVEGGQIQITDQVQFESDSAQLLTSSEDVLYAVLRILSERPDITKISVEGHTDGTGRAKKNLRLSKKRVEAVLRWLVQHGVAPARLSAVGYGGEQPIADNVTEEGRAKNRRVEFHIISVNGGPVDVQGTAH